MIGMIAIGRLAAFTLFGTPWMERCVAPSDAEAQVPEEVPPSGGTDGRKGIATSSEQTRIVLVSPERGSFLGATGDARTVLVVQPTCLRDCCFCSMRVGATTVRRPCSESDPQ